MRESKQNRSENKHKKIFAKIAGTIITGVCTVGLAIASPIMTINTFAETPVIYGSGSIQVNNKSPQQTVFKAFMVLRANKNTDGTLSDFQWPSDAVKNAVLGVIKAENSSYTSQNAQDAAQYISCAYQNASGQMTTDTNTVLKNTELLNKIAAAVDDVTSIPDGTRATIMAGVGTALAEGYWLIVTDGSSIGLDESGTSPIYTVSSGGLVTMNEKTSVVTVKKQVKNDAIYSQWSKVADAQRGQAIQHMVTGSVAYNIATYDSYYYEFEDVMSVGLDFVTGSVKVTVNNTDITDSFTQTLTEGEAGTHKLRVMCNDLLKITKVTIGSDSQPVLTYLVKLNNDCVVGVDGNPNDARIIYSSNPNTDEKSSTHTVRDYLYTYKLHVEKKDRETNVPLSGAKFTIKATNPDDTASLGLYVQADGSLAADPYEFVTKTDGTFNVSGLDVGSYTLHETEAPEGYKFVNADTVFTIVATYGDDGKILTLTNTVSENADAIAGIDSTNDNTMNADSGSAANIPGSVVNVTVGNIEKIKLPLSGRGGITVMIIAGCLVIAVSTVGIFVAEKKRRSDEK